MRDSKILLVKRAHMPGKGLWAIPGGRVNPGETLQEAAAREIMEETGILVRALEPVHVFDYIERDDEGKIRFHYVIVDLMAQYVSGEPTAQDDALEARFFSPEELGKETTSESTLELLKKIGFALVT